MKEKKDKLSFRKKVGIGAGVSLSGFLTIVVIGLVVSSNIQWFDVDDEGTMHLVGRWSSASAEADPGAGASGWLSTFLLDYGQTPGTVLQNNATDWEAAVGSTVHAYEDTDNQETDCPSEDPFYVVIRARFNDTVKDGSDYIDARCFVYLTVSGDETISNVLGTRVVSQNSTGDDFIWINFYWDDAVDGYEISDDGNIAWNCTIYAQY